MNAAGRNPDEPTLLERLIRVISALDLTPNEIAEALWLAAATRGPGTDGLAAREREDGQPPASAELDRAEAPQTATAQNRLPVFPKADPTATPGRTGFPIGVPAPVGSNAQMIGRALRGLRGRAIRGPLSAGLDETATAQRTAQSGIYWPVPKTSRPRRTEAMLLFDDTVSMELWRELESDMFVALLQCGAFRKVSSWSLYHGSGQAWIKPRGRAAAMEQPLSLLRDPTGRSMVLILTDGASPLWHSGAGAAATAELAEFCPVAVIEPLPHRLWRRTGLRVQTALIASASAGSAGPLRMDRDDNGPALPVPVLQPELEWLVAWTDLLSGRTLSARHAVLGRPTAPLRAVTNTSGTPSYQPIEPPTAPALGDRAVRRFQSVASSEAFDLASALSVVPLSLPVMQAVLTRCVPDGALAHLAEVITGGLMHRDPSQQAPASAPAFQWLPGVREELRRTVTVGREREVLEAVSTYLDQDLGFRTGSLEFQAVMAPPDLRSGATAVGYGKYFAQVLPETARRFSERFAVSNTVFIESHGTGAPIEEPLDRLTLLVGQGHASERSEQIEGAIEAARRVVSAAAAGDERHRDAALALAQMLILRWRNTGTLDNLDEAVFVLRDLLRSTNEDGSPDAECLRLLANALKARFEATASPDYLDDAIGVNRAAVAALSATGLDADEHRVLLAETLLRHHEITGTTLSLYEAVDLIAGLEPLDRLEPPLRVNADVTLARCLDVMSRSTRGQADIDAADLQWLTVIDELESVPADAAAAVRAAFESRVQFLARTGRTASAHTLDTAFGRALERLPRDWGRAAEAEGEREVA